MSFPHYHQLEAKDCGPTCLRIVARSFGKKYSLTEMKDLCMVTKQGVSLQDLINGATTLGLDSLSVKVPLKNLGELPLPAILYWRQEHYVVLYKIADTKQGRQYYISDPAFGKIKLNEPTFTAAWLGNDGMGIALLVEPTDAFHARQPRPVSYKRDIANAKEYISNIVKKNMGKSVLALLLVIIAMVATWMFPSIFRRMIDEGVLAKSLNVVYVLLLTQVIVFLSQVISDSLSSILLMQINFKISVQFLIGYLYKLIRLPLRLFDHKVNSDLLLRMDDSDRIQSFLTHHVLEFLLAFINLSIFSIMLFKYNAVSFGVFALFSCMSIVWTVLFLNKRKRLDYARFAVASETRNNIYELITEMPEIKINNAHGNKIGQWQKLQMKLNNIKIKALFLNYYQLIGSNFFNRIKVIAITGICAYTVIQGNMTLGVMMTIGFILGQLNGPIDNIIAIIRGLQDAKLSYNRLEDIQRLKDEVEGKSITLTESPSSSIDLENVSFKYDGSHSPMVLKNVDVSIPVGKITAIVGSSGSGKTTLLKLLLGIYEPTDGRIMLDDADLSKVVPDTWRNRCGVVLQDGFIYSKTYAENIALADKEPDMERVKYAAELACISEFIESLPLGYHTRIGKAGINLSGGQKQRILIARAIYRDPEFIFFDEATSSLDANNEMKILRNLQQFFEGRTVVIIAHRLSTVRNADQIIVLEKGQIVERNNHEGLIKAKGRYFDLVRNQLELGT